MKEIKFRAWNGKQMLQPFIEFKDEIQGFSPSGKWEDYKIMQFTGLKDKNGKEIYEGDILTNNYVFSEVMWNNEMLRYISNSFGLTEKSVKRESIKIIGNIYENPELLNSEKK